MSGVSESARAEAAEAEGSGIGGERGRAGSKETSGRAVRTWKQAEAGHLLGTFDTNHPWLKGLPKRGNKEVTGRIGKVQSMGRKFCEVRTTDRALSFLIMTAIFDTPWTPTLRGNALQPCVLIQALVEDEVQPNSRSTGERPWSFAGYREVVNSVPAAKDAIVESVTAIWRLKTEEEEGGKGESVHSPGWQDHLEAWMVRRNAAVPASGNAC